jgi:hypothetical protein
VVVVTDGIEAALKRARQAAGGKDVWLGGGANAARQYLVAGLVDEMDISLVPTLLGLGERLFEGVGDDLHGLDLVRTVAAPNVTHLKFARPSKGRGRSGFPPAGWHTVTPRRIPPTPSGSSTLWLGPATNPSSDIEIRKRSLDTVSLPLGFAKRSPAISVLFRAYSGEGVPDEVLRAVGVRPLGREVGRPQVALGRRVVDGIDQAPRRDASVRAGPMR